MNKIYTIGHGNKSIQDLLSELKINNIDMLVDVRSVPYSRYCQQFNRESLKLELCNNGIAYKHMPKLGGRYEEKPNTDSWNDAILDLVIESYTKNVAIMCSEQDPYKVCHRHFWIEPDLKSKNVEVIHILKGGNTEQSPPKQSSMI